METSEPDTRWPESDDSQDYWESDLSCIHCPLAVGGKSLYLSTDYLLSSPAQIFSGIKNKQAKIYDNDPGPSPPRHVVLPWFKTIKQTAQLCSNPNDSLPFKPFPHFFCGGGTNQGATERLCLPGYNSQTEPLLCGTNPFRLTMVFIKTNSHKKYPHYPHYKPTGIVKRILIKSVFLSSG